MNYIKVVEKIIELKNTDIAFRDSLIQKGKLEEGYHAEMEKIHNQNAEFLQEIINDIGFPSIDKVGEEAYEATWLIIQHAIAQPKFMKSCAKLLEIAVHERKAKHIHLAYLTDRIAVFEGKPQLYGTQFDWDDNGEMSPHYFEDINLVNERRKSVGLNAMEEQTKIIRRRTKKENQAPPTNLEERRRKMKEWTQSVGWTK